MQTPLRPSPPRATLDQVFALDLLGVSEKLDVSESEFLAGVARSSEPRALGQLLEPVAASDGHGSGERASSRRCQLYRDVCLLLPPTTCRVGGRETLSVLGPCQRANGASVLDAMLWRMARPRIMDHLVVCVPAQAPSHVAADIHRVVDGACSPLGIRVEVLEAQNEADALHKACKYLHRSPAYWVGDEADWSDGFVLVRGDREFDAATFEMMMTAAGQPLEVVEEGEEERRSGGGDDGCAQRVGDLAKVATTLVSFDVSATSMESHGDASDDAPESAGLFAFSRTCLGEMEQLFAVENHGWCRSVEDALAYWATSEVLAVKHVVASDYCNWKAAAQDSSAAGDHGWDRQHRRRSLGESLHSGMGYSGFQIACHTETEPAEGVGTSPLHVRASKTDSPRLGSPTHAPTISSPLLAFSAKDYRSMDDDSHSRLALDVADASESAVTAPELEAVLGPHDQAFLLQTSSCDPMAQALGSPRSCELILAVPDSKLAMAAAAAETEASSALVSLSDLSRCASAMLSDRDGAAGADGMGVRQRSGGRLMVLPSAVREITVEASVRSPPPRRKASEDTSTAITALTSPQSLCVASNRSASASSPGPSAPTATLQVLVKKQVPLVGYLILFTADLAVSSQGAALALLTDVPPLLKLFWRMSGTAVAFLPLAAASVYQRGLPRLSRRELRLLALSAVAHTWFNASFLVALSLTSIGHVYIFNNSHSLLLVLWKLLLRQPLAAQELIGAALGFSGGAVTALDHHSGMARGSAERRLSDWSTTLHGDLLAFAGAFGGVAYLLTAKKLRARMDVPVLLCALSALESLLLLALLVGFRRALGVDVSDLTSRAGLVGWAWHHPGAQAYMVLVGSLIGTMGFVGAMKYFDPLVVSLAMLTEPVVATLIGVLVGVASVPGLATLVGGAGVLAGCLLVVLAAHRTETRVDVSDAVAVAVAVADAGKRPAGGDAHGRGHGHGRWAALAASGARYDEASESRSDAGSSSASASLPASYGSVA